MHHHHPGPPLAGSHMITGFCYLRLKLLPHRNAGHQATKPSCVVRTEACSAEPAPPRSLSLSCVSEIFYLELIPEEWMVVIFLSIKKSVWGFNTAVAVV